MRIPDVESLKDAHEALNASNSTFPDQQPNNDTTAAIEKSALGQPKSFGRASAVLNAANGTSRSTPAEKDVQQHGHLSERQSSCPSGKAFYKCQNGFTGCCSLNPCNPGETCPDGKKDGDQGAKETGKEGGADATTGKATVKATQTQAATESTRTTDTALNASSIKTATATGTLASTTSRRMPRPTASPAPNCPRANRKTYKDSFQIPYRIRCNSDNTFNSFDSIAVGTGGYDQCFSSCSQSEKCAGFTYVGSDSGNCYLKAQMPNTTYEAKRGGNYISCAKLNPDQHAGNDSNAADEPAQKPIGVIVGGVVGGVAFLGLLVFLIGLIARRRRKKIDKGRGTVTHIIHGPIETDMSQQRHENQAQPSYGYGYQQVPPQPPQGYAPGYGQPGQGTGHVRQGSTSHDVFTPYGGNVYDPRTHTRQRSIYNSGAQTWV